LRTRLPDLATSGALPIETIKVSINKRNSRDAMPQILFGLQQLYSNQQLLDSVLDVLGDGIISDKKDTGRPGMSLWQILVLGVVRVGKKLSYPSLVDLVNNHLALRGVLGLGGLSTEYHEETLRDNVVLLTEEMLLKINVLLVNSGSDFFKKRMRNLRYMRDLES